ncbi:hypothetical protein B0T22DRAFT_138542 [Podospora appendiculata]|uniref:Sister chromatid cohesion protein DCC1 n=1 Tax=Podospora appendiculata TaxID=314037 RepID=A0AAE1CBS7_9PEZI|nr:hypothetical protein B0T22DRAFT_138542 [Podospora appendiculata]
MATQEEAVGIPLSHAPDGVGYKLLELPAELVALLESADPPVLTLTPSPTAALLKTPDKTYSLRQKNTSNALILLAPAAAPPTPDKGDAAADTASSSSTGLSLIATIHETIELVPLETGEAVPAARARGKWHEKFGKTR